MSYKVLASALLLSIVDAADIVATDFDTVMEVRYPEYKREVITVTTEDGYILPLFHIWKEGVSDSTKQPVLFQHGAGIDGT